MSDDTSFVNGVRDLIAYVAVRSSGLPRDTIAAFVFEGETNAVGEHALTYAEISNASHIVPDLRRIADAVGAERIALLCFTDDVDLAAQVSGVVASALRLPALRVAVGSTQWQTLGGQHATGEVAQIVHSPVATRAVLDGVTFRVEAP